MNKTEKYIKNVKNFCEPESYGKGIKILGAGIEGQTTEFKLNNGETIAFKGTIVQEKHVWFNDLFSKKRRKKSYKIWKQISTKSDYIIKPYRQEFCYLKILQPVCMELVAMEYGGPNLESFIIKNKKQSEKWWNSLNKQIVDILNTFKKNKITHGDFKLDNIIIVNNGKYPKIKVIDFSFASNKYEKKKQVDFKRIIVELINKYPDNLEAYAVYKKMPKESRKFWKDYAIKEGFDIKQVKK